MLIYIVTTQAREEQPTGPAIGFRVRCWGSYTDVARAQQMATKYGGHVSTVVVDQEQEVTLETWLLGEA
ncbi:MAG: hypothetical protein WC683_01275 [bacterium]